MKKKTIIKIALSGGVLAILFSCLISNMNAYTELEDACVNESNGDVTIAYYYNQIGGVVIKSFDNEGNFLFSEFLPSSGGSSVYLEYDEMSLNVFVSRTSVLYSFDREGNYVLEEVESDSNSLASDHWKRWKKTGNIRKYAYNGREYCYEESSFVERIIKKGSCQFYIQDSTGNKTVLYKSKS